MLLRDVILGGDVWMSRAALEEESSGYWLIPDDASLPNDWRAVQDHEANVIIGRCAPGGGGGTDPGCPCPNGGAGGGGGGGGGGQVAVAEAAVEGAGARIPGAVLSRPMGCRRTSFIRPRPLCVSWTRRWDMLHRAGQRPSSRCPIISAKPCSLPRSPIAISARCGRSIGCLVRARSSGLLSGRRTHVRVHERVPARFRRGAIPGARRERRISCVLAIACRAREGCGQPGPLRTSPTRWQRRGVHAIEWCSVGRSGAYS